MPNHGKYPDELRERAIRMVLDHGHEYGSQWEAICSVAEKLGPKAETVRLWVRQAEKDTGRRPGATTDERAELKRLKRENAELRRANDILKAAAHFFRGGARPPTQEVIAFIDEHKTRRSGDLVWGIEPIAKVLGIAPSTYHAAKTRPPSARSIRDAALKPDVLRVWEQNLSVYGADKVWDQMNKDGIGVARCTVERLMADLGLQGCRRGRVWVRTTEGDNRLDRPADLVKRQFSAPAPNRLWVADLTYVKTHTGWVYVAFIVDVFSRMVVGWQASRSLRADLAIDALEMAVANRGRTDELDQLVHHSDRGVQYLSVRYSDRLSDNDIVASVGSKGDSYDNALCESFNGLYKWELIYPKGPWNGLEDVEFATLTYVDWFNNRRLHGQITEGPGYTTPAAFEADYNCQIVPTA
ncbi:MAG: IS3 family transposase [Acidimicrobiia bacterium]